jgi:hypothetical protein
VSGADGEVQGEHRSGGKRRRWNPFLRLLLKLVLVYVALLVVLGCFQRKLQYFPDRSEVALPAGAEYQGIEDVTFTAADGVRLRAWYWPGQRDVTLLILHGNAGNRRHRLYWMEELHDLGYGVFLLDYRGFGGSEGSPTEQGLYADAEASVKWLRARGAARVVYVGESLGCGVGVELALREKAAAVIVQSGFSSMVEVARRAYPFFPVGLLMVDRYENLPKVPRIGCPLLVVHGERDSIVPVDLGRKLFAAAVEPKEWYGVPHADHNDLIDAAGAEYYERLDAFLRRHVEGQGR